MKTVFIDTNSINENGSFQIHEVIVKNLELQVGEKVIAYQEGDLWQAEVVNENNYWGIVLKSEAKKISKERLEGQEEGFWAGYYAQSIRFLRVLEQLNYSATDIEKIKMKVGIK